MQRKPRLGVRCLCAAAMAVLASGFAHASSPSSSASLAQTLVTVLSEQKLEAIAARDPAEPGRFVAALVVQGGPLLVVSAKHPSASALDQRIGSRDFRNVYLDLQGTPTPAGKYFVQDSGADGIRDAAPSGVDVAYQDGTKQILFDRKLSSQLRGDAYEKALTAADERYAHMLMVLIDAARSAAAPSVTGPTT